MNLKGCVHIALIFVLSCIISCRDWNEPPTVNDKLSKIEDETGLTFPENSSVEQFYQYRKTLEPAWLAKVNIPTTSYESFKEVLLEKPNYDGTVSRRGDEYDPIDWWKPVNVIITKLYWADSSTLVEINVSKDDKEVSVYIDCIVP